MSVNTNTEMLSKGHNPSEHVLSRMQGKAYKASGLTENGLPRLKEKKVLLKN